MSLQPPQISSSRWSARTKRNVVLVCLVVLGFVLINLASLFPLLIASTLLAYLLYPIANVIENRFLRVVLPFRARALAVALTFVVVLALFSLVGFIVAPVLVDQVVQVGDSIPEFLESLQTDVDRWLSQPLAIGTTEIIIDGEPIIPMERFQEITGRENVTDFMSSGDFDVFAIVSRFLGSLGSLTGPAFGVLGGFFTAVVNVAFLLVIVFYLVRDGERFTDNVIVYTPEAYRGDVRRLLYELGKVWHAYLRGQLLLCTAVGFAVYIAALILGLPNPLIFGLMAGLLEFIPNIGPALALIPAFFIALISQSTTFPFLEGLPFALTVAITWTGIQNLEALFLVPRIMGGSLNLHPVVVIIAIITGASVAGILGIILAAPAVATLRLFGVYVYGKLFDIDPFPPPVVVENALQRGFAARWFLMIWRRGSTVIMVFRARPRTREAPVTRGTPSQD